MTVRRKFVYQCLILVLVILHSIITPITLTKAEYDPRKVKDSITVSDPFYKEGWNKVQGKGWIPQKEIKIKIRTRNGYKTLATAKPDREGKFEEWVSIEGLTKIWIEIKNKSSHQDSLGQVSILVVQDYGELGFSSRSEYVELRSGSNPDGGGPSSSSTSEETFNLSAQITKYNKRVYVLNSLYNSTDYIEIPSIFINTTKIHRIQEKTSLLILRHMEIMESK